MPQQRCHTGECGPCDATITASCRCGSETKRMACHLAEQGAAEIAADSEVPAAVRQAAASSTETAALAASSSKSAKEGAFLCQRVCTDERSCKRHKW